MCKSVNNVIIQFHSYEGHICPSSGLHTGNRSGIILGTEWREASEKENLCYSFGYASQLEHNSEHKSDDMVVLLQVEVYLDNSLRVLFVTSVQERFK